jgi:two-component system, chemotaxis family, chemotaxis protein CheY
MKVLVIDDARTVRELLKLHLSNAGYDVLAAEDALAGGRMVLAHAPDLIIVDVNMPYMNGYELVEALKADAATRDIPVVFLSSNADLPERSKELGAAAYLPKPVSADRLLDVVRLLGARA